MVLLFLLVGAAAWSAQQAGVPPGRLVALLVLAPFAEEVLFRAGLQQALVEGGWSTRRAIGFTSLCFALAHLPWHEPAHAALVLLPSLVLGTVYARSGRLVDVVLLHAAMNAVWLAAPRTPWSA